MSIVTRALIDDQSMQSMADAVRYFPGVTMALGEGHRDAPTIRGNNSTADFFVDGLRDDAQYLRDLYNVERVEAVTGANAVSFGRGGGGGVINRVMKQAGWQPIRAVTIEGGSFSHRRTTADFAGAAERLAWRVNGLLQNSGSFRDENDISRVGVNPSLAYSAGNGLTLRASYEYFDDARVVDRGIPSYEGEPVEVPSSTFFGNPEINKSSLRVHAATTSVAYEPRAGVSLVNRTRVADYDKFYANVYPASVTASGSQANLAAYTSATGRRNVLSQTDLLYDAGSHRMLAGADFARQSTDQFRETGYFGNTATSVAVPLTDPISRTPVTFRQSASDPSSIATATVIGVYAQDQVQLTPWFFGVAGIRAERFDLQYTNRRTAGEIGRTDVLLSPRAGVVLKPAEPVSVYGSYSVSHLPGAGDQFTALSVTTRDLEPERFTNREIGAKWDVRSDLSLRTAVFRLDRTNSSAPHPEVASRIVQTGAQRSSGYEVAVSGAVSSAWQIAGGYTSQFARITRTTSEATSGAVVPLTPRDAFSFWNRVQLARWFALGAGVISQSRMSAAIDNRVTLPPFTRFDAALFVNANRWIRAQLNVENVANRRYYASSHGNNNIMPGAPRTLRVSLTATP